MAEDVDPFQWLEEVEGEKPLAWVRAQNERSLKLLQADARYGDLESKALAILEAKDRIPSPGFRAGQVYNFWQDDVNVRGLVRLLFQDHLDLEAYRGGSCINCRGSDCSSPRREPRSSCWRPHWRSPPTTIV